MSPPDAQISTGSLGPTKAKRRSYERTQTCGKVHTGPWVCKILDCALGPRSHAMPASSSTAASPGAQLSGV